MMRDGRRAVMLVWVSVALMAGGQSFPVVPVWGQPKTEPVETKTIIGDLLMVDGDFYIVRGEYGEIQIEATQKTEVAEKFTYGDKIKALVLMNNKALKIERAASDAVTSIVTNQPTTQPGMAQPGKGGPAPVQPDTRTIVADLLMVDGNFYVVRSDYGEIQIEATPKTKITGTFKFGDRIKAVVLMNDKALSIEPAGPKDVPGIVVHKARPPSPSKATDARAAEGNKLPSQGQARSNPAAGMSGKSPSETRVVEGDVLMVDGEFYILRGPEGEIRVERTDKTRMSEEFDFGDRIKATVLKNNKALSIERAK